MAKTKSNGVKEEPAAAPPHGGAFAAAYAGASVVLSILMVTAGLGPAVAFAIPTAAGAFAVAAYLARPKDCGAALPTAVGTSIVMAAYAVAIIIAGPGEGALYAAAAMLAAFSHLAVLAATGCQDGDILYV